MASLPRQAFSWSVPAIAALALTACGGTQAANSPSTPATTATPSASPSMSMSASAPAAQAPVAATAVTISNFAFSPASITVKAGSTVSWTNQDQDAHTIAFQGQAPSKVLQMGDTFSRTFTQPGTYSYICSIHPFMKGTVTVS